MSINIKDFQFFVIRCAHIKNARPNQIKKICDEFAIMKLIYIDKVMDLDTKYSFIRDKISLSDSIIFYSSENSNIGDLMTLINLLGDEDFCDECFNVENITNMCMSDFPDGQRMIDVTVSNEWNF